MGTSSSTGTNRRFPLVDGVAKVTVAGRGACGIEQTQHSELAVCRPLLCSPEEHLGVASEGPGMRGLRGRESAMGFSAVAFCLAHARVA
jgi:hypothetical protein